MTEDAEAIVAAILTAVRLAQQGGPQKGQKQQHCLSG
jgi:hypothetical protein